jgi:hypothetical protein
MSKASLIALLRGAHGSGGSAAALPKAEPDVEANEAPSKEVLKARESERKARAKAEPKPKAEPKLKAEPKAEPKAKAKAGRKTEAKAVDAAPESEHKAKAKAEPKTEAKAKAERKAKAKAVDAAPEMTEGAVVVNYDKMTVPQLKAMCREGNMSLSGNKGELLARVRNPPHLATFTPPSESACSYEWDPTSPKTVSEFFGAGCVLSRACDVFFLAGCVLSRACDHVCSPFSRAQEGYFVQHAKSGRASCVRCLGKIVQNRVRVGWHSATDFGQECERWMHAEWYVRKNARSRQVRPSLQRLTTR